MNSCCGHEMLHQERKNKKKWIEIYIHTPRTEKKIEWKNARKWYNNTIPVSYTVDSIHHLCDFHDIFCIRGVCIMSGRKTYIEYASTCTLHYIQSFVQLFFVLFNACTYAHAHTHTHIFNVWKIWRDDRRARERNHFVIIYANDVSCSNFQWENLSFSKRWRFALIQTHSITHGSLWFHGGIVCCEVLLE